MPDTVLLWSAALLGAIAGSFINALVYRFHSGESMMGRSHCVKCRHTLSAVDMVPVLSFVLLRGQCRYCGEPISFQYPLVELTAAVLSAGILLFNPAPIPSLLAFFFWMTVLFAVGYDVRFQELPNKALLISGVLGFVIMAINYTVTDSYFPVPSWLALLSGPIVALPLLAISALSKETYMGWGDGLLELGFGWLLGITGGFSALFIGIWAGAIVGLTLVAWQSFHNRSPKSASVHAMPSVTAVKQVTMKSRIPFAPFLALGALAVYFFHANFIAALWVV